MIYKNTRRFSRKIAFVLSWILLFQAFLPVSSFALTSGPSQPEFNSFEPVGTTQMVDPFTGSFVYNIPLFELPGPDGGYPFNLSYKPDGSINAESGPFGYGWTINPGNISRDVRGVPDDHNGEERIETNSIRDNWTVGADVGAGIEAFGLDDVFSGSLGVYYNSYRGVGVTTSLGMSLALSESGGSRVGLGLGFDSQEGFNVSPSLTIGGLYSASTSINSRRGMTGLSLSISPQITKDVEIVDKDNLVEHKTVNRSMSYYGANISLGGGASSPSLTMPWNTASLSGKVKLGGSFLTIFGNASIGGSFSLQRLKDKGKPLTKKTYGYLYAENGENEGNGAVLDFSREKDGPITENSPNIGIPMTTPDIYAATGQGMAGMFRPYRSDIGVLYDPEVTSKGGGGSFSLDAPVFKTGGSGNISFTTNESKKWDNSFTDESNGHDFVDKDPSDPSYETYYFKTQGEKIAEATDAIEKHIGGEEPMRPMVNLGGISNGATYLGKDNMTQIDTDPLSSVSVKRKRTERKPRGLVIQDYSNEIAPNIPVFNAKIYNGPIMSMSDAGDSNKSNFSHSPDYPDQIGGFISTDTKGVRYVYGIPACNKVKESYTFSVQPKPYNCDPLVDVDVDTDCTGSTDPNCREVDYEKSGTDKYYKKIVEEPFAHSHLLTSVLGSNYIDVDNNGPSVDDIGYWVKFNYAQIHDEFAWRSPYIRAFYDRGIKERSNDDKGSFTYGEKEIWMLGSVETKTHVAVFIMGEREDGKSAPGRFYNSASNLSTSDELYRVEEIQLFTRSAWESNDPNPQPLRTVHFGYDYLISSEVPNSSSSNGSKLTLSELWFTSENSTRGENNKYQFDYGIDPANPNDPITNPPYTATGFDRWGNYFETDPNSQSTDDCGNIDFPYTNQGTDIVERTANTSVWNIKEITLPSGSTIKVDWEPNRYSHVQNKQVTEMVKIHAMGDPTENVINDLTTVPFAETVRIYFEKELNTTSKDYFEGLPITNAIDGTRQLYFKARTRLFPNSSLDEYQDISGYLEIASYEGDGEDGGVDNGDNLFYVDVKKLKPKDSYIPYHPFSVYAWQFMKSQLPERLLAAPGMPDALQEEGLDGKSLVKKLATYVGAIFDLFGGFYSACEAKQFATAIDLDHSYIKLCSPDKEKFGAGARVAKIELQDVWEEHSTYGQQYTYYDGVATNEPSIGGDENPLRYAKVYPNNLLMATDEVHFFEYPINENLYPGPSIGYGRVEVKSLATHLDEEARNSSEPRPAWLADGMATTGKVVHEFYTAKDFPVIVDETRLDNPADKDFYPVFPIGSYQEERITSSQGYSIIKNDMHGKPKKVSNYAQDAAGDFLSDPYNYVNYNYKHKVITHNGQEVKVLDNKVNVLTDYDPEEIGGSGVYQMPQGERLVGVDYEMVNDMRLNKTFTSDIGAQFNADFLVVPPFPPFPLFTVWGSSNIHRSITKTAATNKMIFKSGILESMDAFDGGSYVTTENLLFDPYTGDALLTQLTNEFGDDLYNLSVPGHMVYDGMGPAYENTGSSFIVNLEYDATCNLFEITNPDEDMIIGDEYFVTLPDGFAGTAVNVQKRGTSSLLDIEGANPIGGVAAVELNLIRSGNRNQVMAAVSSISAMSDPTKEISIEECDISVEVGSYVPSNSTIMLMTNYAYSHRDIINRLLVTDSDGVPPNDFFDDEPINLYEHPNYSDFNWDDEPTNEFWPTYYDPDKPLFYESSNVTCSNGVIQPRIYNLGLDGTVYNPSYVFSTANLECSGFPAIPPCYDFSDLVHVNLPTKCDDIGAFGPVGNIELEFNSGIEEYSLQFLMGYGLFHIYDVDPGTFISPEELNSSVFTTNNILNISAQTTKDIWQENLPNQSLFDQLQINHSKPRNWYADKGVAYVDNRMQAGNGNVGTSVNIQNDGVMNDVALFNFQDPFFTQCNDSKWVETAKVTQYDQGNEVENKDALGIYSAALFGYQNNLSTAVAQNARYREIGYENFENFSLGALNNTNQEPNKGSHLDFVQDNGFVYQSYELVSGKNDVIIIDAANTDDFLSAPHVKLDIQFRDGSTQQISANVIGGVTQNTNQANPEKGNTLMALTYNDCEPTLANGDPFTDAIWKGTVYVPQQATPFSSGLNMSTGSAFVYNSSGDVPVKAHSGEQYLALPANSTGSIQLKRTLQLQIGKEYHISAWVARDRDKMHPNLPDMLKINGEPLEVTTDVIEGWVKVEKTFVAAGPIENGITFHADPVTTYNENGNSITVNSGLYIDDIRIQPAQSSMVTYVYDPVNYRLKATLDQNNYATFYEYDHEGRLITLKKETERGVKTIQHNQNHLAKIEPE